ncbi:peptidoglycan DD-metalloendopeptidase family protein [Pseudonocardia oceani]|uniref:peptidoglycan DD-metalloendopeptidase family protein n=1 Tax=Pseudonocardia oceani TaxID=2792013 RepID=UPI001CED71BE|nr:M23 family metallopeptidase [Pseudonocardia oceani]
MLTAVLVAGALVAPGAVPSGAAIPTAHIPTAATPTVTAPAPPVPPPLPPPSAPAPPAEPPPVTPPAPPLAGVPAPGARYAWPLLPVPPVRTPFRAPEHAYGPGHRGVDLAGAPGQAVLAARGGTVVFAGPVGGRSLVSVQHDDGLRTTYEPVEPAVTAGAVVGAGAVLGVLGPGHPGCPGCLHWGVRRDRTEYLDPLVLLRPPRVRLLPVPDPWPG